MAILKDLTAAQPIVRVAADPKLTLRAKMVSALTDQMSAVTAALENKKFIKSRKVTVNGEETMKDVRFRPNFGKNAMGEFVYELKYGNKPLVIPAIKSHAVKCGRDLKDVKGVIAKLIEATVGGELDALLIKQSQERAAKRKPRAA